MTIVESPDTKGATQNVKPWTSKEIAELRRVGDLGAELAAELLDRSVESVRQAAKRHRISLRQAGSRRGLILGQPRGVSFLDVKASAAEVGALAEIRKLTLEGELDPAKLEDAVMRYTRWIAAGSPLCPNCVARPAENNRTGFCTPCHLKALAQAHRDDQATLDAKREHARERQRSVRRRKPLKSQPKPTPEPSCNWTSAFTPTTGEEPTQ